MEQLGSFHREFVVPVDCPTVFVRSLSGSLNLPVDQGEPIQTVSNGDAFLGAFLKDIDGARRSSNIMVYIWTDGRMSVRADALDPCTHKKCRLRGRGGISSRSDRFDPS